MVGSRDGHRVNLKKKFHNNDLRRNTVTVPTTIDPGAWLSKHLIGEDGDIDLARAMLGAFAETPMSAQASMLCEAGYNERSDEGVN